MDLEIEDKLKEMYEYIRIKVKFIEFRIYLIELNIEFRNQLFTTSFKYLYDVNLTIDANLNIIKSQIDKKILLFYKRGSNKYE